VRFLFDDFVLDPERRELTRGAEAIDVAPQVFDLLVYLVQHRDRVVSKDGLLEAIWGDRIVSESTLTSHINAARKAVGDNGDEQRLIRTIARKGFRFVGDVAETLVELNNVSPPPALPLPDRPSIAVLPFRNLSGDPEQEYFADGMVEDIIAALSRIRVLFVIARDSSFTYKGRTVDIKQVGRELGVRYVLEGTLRRAGGRVRITGQLIDATSATYIWAERFEGILEDVFELQDQMVTSVVGAIRPQIESAEIERAKQTPPANLSAHDCYLRGVASLKEGSRNAIDEALPEFRKAIELDPDYASAYGMAASCIFWRKINGWMTDREEEIREGIRLARIAIELGKNDAIALARGGHALAHFTGDLDCGIALLERARILDPNLVSAWFLGGFLSALNGDYDRAIAQLSWAMRLSPLDRETYRMQAGMALANLFAGRFDEASSWAEKAFRDSPSFLAVVAIIAASHALAGRLEEAQQALHKLGELDPTLRVSFVKDWLDIRNSESLALFEEGLRKAGLPE
jgi:TolB-like protein/tetratricopeptide (TPR) repeat protein